MISRVFQNSDDQIDDTPAQPEEYISPAPRVSVQAFCASVAVATAVRAASEDRRLGKAHLSVHMGGLAAAIDAYLLVIEADREPYRFIVHRPLLERPSTVDPMADYTAVVAAHAARLIGEGLRRAGLDTAPAELWGHALVGYVRAGGDWWLDHPTISRPVLTEYLTALLWSGFRGIDA